MGGKKKPVASQERVCVWNWPFRPFHDHVQRTPNNSEIRYGELFQGDRESVAVFWRHKGSIYIVVTLCVVHCYGRVYGLLLRMRFWRDELGRSWIIRVRKVYSEIVLHREKSNWRAREVVYERLRISKSPRAVSFCKFERARSPSTATVETSATVYASFRLERRTYRYNNHEVSIGKKRRRKTRHDNTVFESRRSYGHKMKKRE